MKKMNLRYRSSSEYHSTNWYCYLKSELFSYPTYTEMLPVGFTGTTQDRINFGHFRIPWKAITNLPNGIEIIR